MTEEQTDRFEDSYLNDYVSLHNHTTFSILDSLIKPIHLFETAKALGQKSIAVTDHGTMAGMWDSLKASRTTGVKMIAGCEMYFVDDVAVEDARMRHIVLLAKNETGYHNLLSMVAEGYDNLYAASRRVFPRIDWGILKKYSEGLICTTACANGILGQLINSKQDDQAWEQAERLQRIFEDDLAIEIQPHALKRKNTSYSGEIDQTATNRKLRQIAEECGIKCIIATDAHYVSKDQHRAHDTMLAIAAGQPVGSGARLKYDFADMSMRSSEEIYNKMARLPSQRDFARQCLENTKYFADKCEFPEWIDPKYSNPSGKELPEFPVQDQNDYAEFKKWADQKDNSSDENELYLKFKCYQALDEEFKNDESYKKRLEEELDVLNHCGVAGYMLIVMDLLDWCRKNGVSVGPGRGSVGGSLVAYLLGIHKADPIKYGLVFARFHNKLKEDYSDVDLDFSTNNRHKVIKYIIDKYGEQNVAAISNYNTITPKVYARAIARAFVYGGDRKTAVQVGTALADAIPNEIKTVPSALEKAPLFAEYAKPLADGGGGYTELGEFAEAIGSQIGAISTHAAGIIINVRSLRGLVPLRRDKEGNLSVEYEKERAEENGLVKMDFLGLSTLDKIDETYELIKNNNKEIKEFDYNSYNESAYELIGSGNTFGVFQFGTSAGTMDLCKRYGPKSIEDLAIITTLARPAAKDIRNDFFKTKNGEKKVKLLHPLLERAFKNTLGFALFDESLLYLTEDVAKWDLHEADALRKLTKAKGKYPEKAKKIQKDFISDAVKNGLSEKEAKDIWVKVIDPFQKYSFNKSHAVLYSMISYHTAWLKANYPLEFLVANLKSEVNSNARIAKDNIAKIKEEIRALNVKIIPPNINDSETTYKIIDNKTLLTGFDALKYIGKDAIPEILAKRPFDSFEDFLRKVDGRKVRAPAIQALAASGCLDSFHMPRKLMFLYATDYRKKLGAFLKRKNAEGSFNYPWPKEAEWTVPELCALEKYYLGESLSGDKVQAYSDPKLGRFFTYEAREFRHLPKLHPPPPADMKVKDQRKYTKHITRLQAEVKNIFEFKVKKEDSKIKGEVMAKLTLEDPHGNQMTMTCFPDGWVKLQNRCQELSSNKHKIEAGVGLWLNGDLNWYEGDLSVIYGELTRFAPNPPLPEDLKAKKVTMRRTKKAKSTNEESSDRNLLLEEIENELIETGNSDLDDDEDEEGFDFS